MHDKMITKTAAAEVSLKAYTFCDPAMLADLPGGERMMQQMAASIDLTEAPEDAVCSLVIDLMHYCEREKIDWDQDIISVTQSRFNTERRASNVR